MLKALFKKQMMEVNTWLIQDKKSGKRRSQAGIIGLIVLYVFLFAFLGVAFFGVSYMLCPALLSVGLGWLYFAIMGLIAVMLGVFGSVFNTYTTLYKAKDNEFLLSLPIPPSHILTVRLFGVWFWSLIYEALVFIPALIVYWINGGAGVLSYLFGVLLLLLISVFVLTLSCILGWVVAKISTKLKNKSMITVLLSLGFLALYYYVYFKANAMLQYLLANADDISNKVKGAAYPLYWLGRAGEGDALSMLLFTLLIGVIFAAVYLVMSRSFLKMATTSEKTAKQAYKKQEARAKSVDMALFGKEWRRYLSSAVYMLNCSLGTLFMPIAGVVLLIQADTVRTLLSALALDTGLGALIGCAAVCFMASMNDITAPSVSLEGKNLWLVQSLPVMPWQILRAKLNLHLVLTEIPVIFCWICLMIVLRPDVLVVLLSLAVCLLFVFFNALFGLILNLKMPNLKWTNETIPVKQSMAVFVAMFGSWVLVMLLAVLCFVLHSFLNSALLLTACLALFCVMDGLLLFWMKKKGTKTLASL